MLTSSNASSSLHDDASDLFDGSAPLQDLVYAVFTEVPHAFGLSHSTYLIGTFSLDRESFYRLGDQHDLVDAEAALVAGAVAALATDRLVEFDVLPVFNGFGGEIVAPQHLLRRPVLLTACLCLLYTSPSPRDRTRSR